MKVTVTFCHMFLESLLTFYTGIVTSMSIS